MAQLKRLFLVRQGQVDAAEPERRQGRQGRAQVFRPDGERNVGAVDPVMFEPIAMQAGRQRMLDRPADDPGDARLAAGNHVAITPWLRRKSISGNRGKPRIVK